VTGHAAINRPALGHGTVHTSCRQSPPAGWPRYDLGFILPASAGRRDCDARL